MRIVAVCRTYPTQRPGGMPHVCQDRAEALARAGHDVHVLTTGHPELPAELHTGGVMVHHLDCPPQQYTDAFAKACAEACRRLSPDVLHLDSFDRSRVWWADRPGAPSCVVVTMHGFALGAWLTRWNLHLDGGRSMAPDQAEMRREAQALARADRVLAISRHEQWMLQDAYNLYGLVRLVYNPIARCFFEQEATAPPVDGPFVCAGNPGTSGNRAFHLARQAAERAGARLDVIRGVAREGMPATYSGSRALVLPTYWSQGYDLTVAEALACRRPVIVTATGSYIREAEENPHFELVPRGDVERLVAAMAGPLPPVPAGVANVHRPEAHVANWLNALEVS